MMNLSSLDSFDIVILIFHRLLSTSCRTLHRTIFWSRARFSSSPVHDRTSMRRAYRAEQAFNSYNPAQSRTKHQFAEINSKFRSCAEHVLEPFPNARNATSKQPFADVPVAQLARSTPRRMKLFFWPVSLMTRWPCVLTRCCVVPSRHWQSFDNLKWSSLRCWSLDLSAVLRTFGGWRSSNFSLFICTFEADLIVQRHVSRSKRILVSHDLKRDSVVSVVPCR